jgi:type 2 lantibiotic biosynthesis protein LanM
MPDPHLPFQELFAGMAADAARKVSAETGLPGRVLASSQQDLLRSLTGLAAWPLTAALRVFPARPGPSGNMAYREFVSRMLDGGLGGFFSEFPVLSRLVAVCIDDWIAAAREFSSRLRKDRPALVRVFGGGAAAAIADLDVSLSDRHGGRSVIGVTFTSGLKLIYKPRDMAMERVWFELLDWVNSHGAPADQRVLRILERSGYGWEEFVPAEPCRNRAGARDFFVRAGALQSLLYVLNATDAHMGNLIACGPRPVLVDAECLLQPARRNTAEQNNDEAALRDLLQTGLLPRPKVIEIDPFDLSGLAGHGGQPTDYRVPVWTAGSLAFAQGVLLPQSNLPVYNGVPLELRAHRDEFLQGFGEMHAYLQDRRRELLARGGPLRPMFTCTSRVLLHTTRFYMALLSRSLRPSFLRDGALRSAMLRGILANQQPAIERLIVEAEAAAIESLNIPYFTAPLGGRSLATSGRLLFPSYFDASGPEITEARLTAIGEHTRKHQVSVLRILFAMSALPAT